jgi:hypothetical protein
MKTATMNIGSKEVFQLNIFANANGLSALTTEEREAVEAYRADRARRDERNRYYVLHGCFPDGTRLYP